MPKKTTPTDYEKEARLGSRSAGLAELEAFEEGQMQATLEQRRVAEKFKRDGALHATSKPSGWERD